MVWSVCPSVQASVLVHRAEAGKQPVSGWLVGSATGSTRYVLSIMRCLSYTPTASSSRSLPLPDAAKELPALGVLPHGLEILGAYVQAPEQVDAADTQTWLTDALADDTVRNAYRALAQDSAPLLLAVASSLPGLSWYQLAPGSTGSVSACSASDVAVADDTQTEFEAQFALVRLQTDLPLIALRSHAFETMATWANGISLQLSSPYVALLFPSRRLVVHRNSQDAGSVDEALLQPQAAAAAAGTAVHHASGGKGGGKKGKKGRKNTGRSSSAVAAELDSSQRGGMDGDVIAWRVPVINATMLNQIGFPLQEEEKERAPAAVAHSLRTPPSQQWLLHKYQVNAVAYVARSASVASAVRAVLDAAVAQVLEFVLQQQRQEQIGLASVGVRPTAYHFQPPALPHLVTTVYSVNPDSPDDEMAHLPPQRLALHARLGLPLRPLFRIGNAVDFASAAARDTGKPARLRDPHLHVAGSGVKGGQQFMVQGSLDYHHYMQDSFNDQGWGCAYRSMQTIASWLQLQGYASRAPPSHGEMQETLVKLGDKPSAFVRSKEWIGALELSMLLDSLYGVSCKILNISSGADITGKSRELAEHFATHGTPVMIGGGVLAYTLLGIDWCEDTGDVRYMILDPHYTGADDMRSAINGGWCAWKRAEQVFRADSFYNLCQPQRPSSY